MTTLRVAAAASAMVLVGAAAAQADAARDADQALSETANAIKNSEPTIVSAAPAEERVVSSWRRGGLWSDHESGADPRVWRDLATAMPLALRPKPAPLPEPEPAPEEIDEIYSEYPPGVEPEPTLRPASLKLGPSPYESQTRSAVVVDLTSGEVLYQRGAYDPVPPASMTKIMTLYVALKAIQAGEASLDDVVPVSRRAAEQPGSRMGLHAGQTPRLGDLLKGLMVVSGNDAAIAIAEATAGGVDPFVERMNAAAMALGLESSSFRNPSGLTDEGHAMSARDVATLSQTLIEEHPEAFQMFSRRYFEWRGAAHPSTNPLMFADLSDIGVTPEGLKTGFTGAAGYCVTVSAVRRNEAGEEQRVIAVLAGMPSKDVRRAEAERVVRWAFDLL